MKIILLRGFEINCGDFEDLFTSVLVKKTLNISFTFPFYFEIVYDALFEMFKFDTSYTPVKQNCKGNL